MKVMRAGSSSSSMSVDGLGGNVFCSRIDYRNRLKVHCNDTYELYVSHKDGPEEVVPMDMDWWHRWN
jgi:hypothetical protein